MKNNILLVDLGGIFHRIYHRYEKTNMDILYELKRQFIETILFVKKKYMIKTIVIANEISRHENWRREFFAEYKANRDKKVLDEDKKAEAEKLKSVKLEFYSWCKKLDSLNIYNIGEEKCEGDDIIGSIILNKTSEDNFFIFSDDKDFQQLMKIENVKQISISEIDWLVKPEYHDIRFHIAIGDSIDGIPNLKRGFGEAKISKLLIENKFEQWVEQNNLQEKYDLNNRLINMKNIPLVYQNSIIGKFNEIMRNQKSINLSELSQFLYENEIYHVDVVAIFR
jgi:5'-3' exonuclease